ncbi:MAG TPA: hypothetical protein VIH61_08490 [Waddliaceae bacterium]
MTKWIQQFVHSSFQTKVFVLMGITYGLAIVLSTLCVYARLDFVRSYPIKTHTMESQNTNTK